MSTYYVEYVYRPVRDTSLTDEEWGELCYEAHDLLVDNCDDGNHIEICDGLSEDSILFEEGKIYEDAAEYDPADPDTYYTLRGDIFTAPTDVRRLIFAALGYAWSEHLRKVRKT